MTIAYYMVKYNQHINNVRLEKLIGGGQSLGALPDGRKIFVWGGLPGETVTVSVTKSKATWLEGIADEIQSASPHRVEPADEDSYLSTSPWQIMDFATEQRAKSQLTKEAFRLHGIDLPTEVTVRSDGREYAYRNKMEYSFWFDKTSSKLNLAFFRRGSHGKIPIEHTSLAMPAITDSSKLILAALNEAGVGGRELKSLLIRSNQAGKTAWQLYVRNDNFDTTRFLGNLPPVLADRGAVIYSDPRSPASVTTKVLLRPGNDHLSDKLLGVSFQYTASSFFQVNLPVYELALRDMRNDILKSAPLVDLYSGVGTIGLTMPNQDVVMVESNKSAVDEMRLNVRRLARSNAKAILSPSEKALELLDGHSVVVVDPPRAGLDKKVIDRILHVLPPQILYLSCNPVTQARDIAGLTSSYSIDHSYGYNFFPRTPHLEHLVILNRNSVVL